MYYLYGTEVQMPRIVLQWNAMKLQKRIQVKCSQNFCIPRKIDNRYNVLQKNHKEHILCGCKLWLWSRLCHVFLQKSRIFALWRSYRFTTLTLIKMIDYLVKTRSISRKYRCKNSPDKFPISPSVPFEKNPYLLTIKTDSYPKNSCYAPR